MYDCGLQKLIIIRVYYHLQKQHCAPKKHTGVATCFVFVKETVLEESWQTKGKVQRDGFTCDIGARLIVGYIDTDILGVFSVFFVVLLSSCTYIFSRGSSIQFNFLFSSLEIFFCYTRRFGKLVLGVKLC